MSCIVNFQNRSYIPEEFNAVIKPFYRMIEKELHNADLKILKNGNIQGSIHNTSLLNKQIITINNINRKYKGLSIDNSNILKSINPRKSVWNLNINGVSEILIDAYRRQKNLYGGTKNVLDGQVLYQVINEKRKQLSPNDKLEELLKNFLKTNGIRVEVYNTLKEKLGVDAAGAYNVIDRLILLSNGRNDTTLPEEVGHTIIETLGNDHPLVKSFLNNLKTVDYKSIIDKQYLDIYQGDENKLLKEAAGQLVGKAITRNFNEPIMSKFKDIINKIITKVLKIFNLDNSTLRNEFAKVHKDADDLAKQVINNSFIPQFNKELSDTKPDNPWFYQAKKQLKIVNPDLEKDIEVFNLQKKRVKALKNKLKTETDPAKISSIEERIEDYENKILDYKKSGKRSDLLALSKYTLNNIEELIQSYETGETTAESITGNDLAFIIDALSKFKSHPSLNAKAVELSQRIKPLYQQFITEWINSHRTDKNDRSWEDIMEQEKDVNSYTKNLAALADTNSVIGSTVGSMIKENQNKISRYDKKVSEEIQEEVELLKKTQTERGITGDNIYDIFITEGKRTSYFVGPFNNQYFQDLFEAKKKLASANTDMIAEGKTWFKTYGNRNKEFKEEEIPKKYRNENYFIIQSNKGLKRFYDFYNSKIEEAFSKLPIEQTNTGNFLPNIAENALRELVKRNGFSQAMMQNFSDFLKIQDYIIDDEGRKVDLSENNIPLLFVKDLATNEKSKDIGNSLNVFLRFANSHNEMTELLPKLRLLEDTLKSKTYISSTSNREITGDNSNLSKMVHDYIEMQVKGNMKKDSGKVELPFLDYVDEDGKTHRKYIHLSNIGDKLLGYNSLLRIGLNPVNAFANIVTGETANFMESFGGQFFSGKNLKKATTIFFQQIFKDESKLNKIIETLNPLQELEDYEALTGTAKKMSKEKLKEYMFYLQRKGELYLQVRPMIASMMNDTIIDKDGNKHNLWEAFDEKGNWKSDLFGELTDSKINKMSNRIQRLNQIIHGRYSSRDAATASQNVLIRSVMQFRKWIPSALETRFASYHFDNRLGEEIEGRWRTFGRLVYEGLSPNKRSYIDMMSSLFKDKEKLENGVNLTPMERANIRKNMIETVLIAGSIVLGFMIFADDDKDKIKHPFAKMMAEQLNRISGDLLYFMNPQEYVSLGRNAIPVAKTMGDMLLTLKYIPYIFGGEDSEYKSGPRKGENKFYSRAASVIPLGKPITDVVRYFNDEPYIRVERK